MSKLLKEKIGFGIVLLGNMYCNILEEEVIVIVDVVWKNGVCYFDIVLFYGFGLVEICFGEVLLKRNCDDYFLSMKVGWIILDELEDLFVCDLGEKGGFFEFGCKNKMINDYSIDVIFCFIE